MRLTQKLRLTPKSAALATFAVLMLAPTLTSGPAQAQYDRRYSGSSADATERDDEGRGLFGGLFGGNERPRREQAPQGAQQYSQMSAPDLAMRLERLENQLRQLTGSIEQLQFRNQQLELQVRRNHEDVDFRLQEMGGGKAPARRPQPSAQTTQPPAAAPPAPQPSAAPPGRRSDVFDPNENPGAPGAPQTLGSVPTRTASGGPAVDEEPQAGPSGGRGAPLDLGTLSDVPGGQGDPPPVVTGSGQEPRTIPGVLPPPPQRNPNATGGRQQLASAPTATPRDEFALAQGYVQRKDYALAEESLREFLKKHPADRLVPEAHYWLGETLYLRQRYRDAAESFLTVSTKYEKSGRAPDALLRLGQSLAALGEREAACATLGEVSRKYPKASANVKQNAEREQKRVRC
jgi:tol-pal system protein YbgF